MTGLKTPQEGSKLLTINGVTILLDPTEDPEEVEARLKVLHKKRDNGKIWMLA